MLVSARVLVPALALSFLSLACPANKKMQVPPSTNPAVVSEQPAGHGQGSNPGDVDTDVSSTSLGGRPDGAACFSNDNCLSHICEGASCDSSRPGTCVSKDRVCTSDLVEFCGCDGNTFLSSSSCPGEPFSVRGTCPGESVETDEDGDLEDEEAK